MDIRLYHILASHFFIFDTFFSKVTNLDSFIQFNLLLLKIFIIIIKLTNSKDVFKTFYSNNL